MNLKIYKLSITFQNLINVQLCKLPCQESFRSTEVLKKWINCFLGSFLGRPHLCCRPSKVNCFISHLYFIHFISHLFHVWFLFSFNHDYLMTSIIVDCLLVSELARLISSSFPDEHLRPIMAWQDLSRSSWWNWNQNKSDATSLECFIIHRPA